MGNGSGAGGTACLETNPPANLATDCQTCLVANENPTNDGCCLIATTDPMGFTLCQAASACMRAGGPPVGTCNVMGDVTSCFCGTNPSTCDSPSQANGPCVNQVKAAAGRDVVMHATDSPTAAQILARFGDPRYAVGRAANIHGITAFLSHRMWDRTMTPANDIRRSDRMTSLLISRWPLAALLLAAMLVPAACKRANAPAAAERADVPSGCVETDPPAAQAAACMACLKRNKIESPMKDGCCGISDAVGQQLCQAVSACMRGGRAANRQLQPRR